MGIDRLDFELNALGLWMMGEEWRGLIARL
jgi:hypothetical protein